MEEKLNDVKMGMLFALTFIVYLIYVAENYDEPKKSRDWRTAAFDNQRTNYYEMIQIEKETK